MTASDPRFVVLALADDGAEIVKQGTTSHETFRRLFLDSYQLEGERHHPGVGALIRGVLLATDAASAVSVPIWGWDADDRSTIWLCQATDDGEAPAFSAYATSQRELLEEINSALGR